MIDILDFRAAMSRLGAAVNIITTDGPFGRYGMTASAVCSVTDSPASLLVCINRSSRMHEVVRSNGVLCVNVLSAEHQELSGVFANRELSMEQRFARAEWEAIAFGAPALEGALCNFGCVVESANEVGTHTVFFCRVEQLHMGADGEGLVYFGRSYHRLPSAVAA